jgi:hypothetical protein
VSSNLFSKDGVGISTYIGPELPLSDNRRRYQITNLDTGALITLDQQQWRALREWFSRDDSAKEQA